MLVLQATKGAVHMGNVIDFEEWRERLGRVPAAASMRRSRRGQGKEENPATGSDLSDELRRLLLQSLRE
jgi:hypothetical protein